jgi:hypothetical protein
MQPSSVPFGFVIAAIHGIHFTAESAERQIENLEFRNLPVLHHLFGF